MLSFILLTLLWQAIFAPVVLGVVAVSSTLIRTADVSYSQHRLRQEGIHPLGALWLVWGCGISASYLNLPTKWQPVSAFLLAVVWNALLSMRLHKPSPLVQTDVDNLPDFLRSNRKWSG